jgi:hypothetical protein
MIELNSTTSSRATVNKTFNKDYRHRKLNKEVEMLALSCESKPMNVTPLTILILASIFFLQGCGGNTESSRTDSSGDNLTAASMTVPAPASMGTILSEVEDSGVKVTFFLVEGGNGKHWLRATFSPLELGFHVYSKDLPKDGIDGIGRPTLLELIENPAIANIGELTADKKIHNLMSPLNADGFPVYPDGPVTLSLPFTMKQDANGTVDVMAKITYMACTKTSCNAPVEGKAVKLTLK